MSDNRLREPKNSGIPCGSAYCSHRIYPPLKGMAD